jgi:hypothetical protein
LPFLKFTDNLIADYNDTVEFARNEILRFIGGLKDRNIITSTQEASLQVLLAKDR